MLGQICELVIIIIISAKIGVCCDSFKTSENCLMIFVRELLRGGDLSPPHEYRQAWDCLD